MKRSETGQNDGLCAHFARCSSPEREVAMLWFRKVVVGAATGAALLAFSFNPGYTQVGPRGATTPSGQFGGLGMQVNMEDGLLKVVSPIDDTPAARAGILAGDVIDQVDGAPVKGLSLTQAVEKMRGAPGTEVRLEILRKGKDAPLNLSLVREIIKVSSVRQQVEGDDVGYVRITQFNGRVADDLKQ